MVDGQDIKFEFIEIEQAIHLITDISATQDISGYLALVEEVYDDEVKLSELIFLLYRKYNTVYDDYTKEYLKWLSFLLPFMQYLVQIDFDYQRISKLTVSDIKERIAETFTKLKEYLPEADFIDKSITSIPKLLTKFDQIKKTLIQSKLPRDIKFYRHLGELSFLIHLLNFCNTDNLAIMQIFILSTLYFDKIAKIIASSEEAKTIFSCMGSPVVNLSFGQQLLRQLVSDLKTKNKLKIDEKMLKLQIFEPLIFLILRSPQKDVKKFFLEPNPTPTTQKSLFTTPSKELKKSPNKPILNKSQEPNNTQLQRIDAPNQELNRPIFSPSALSNSIFSPIPPTNQQEPRNLFNMPNTGQTEPNRSLFSSSAPSNSLFFPVFPNNQQESRNLFSMPNGTQQSLAFPSNALLNSFNSSSSVFIPQQEARNLFNMLNETQQPDPNRPFSWPSNHNLSPTLPKNQVEPKSLFLNSSGSQLPQSNGLLQHNEPKAFVFDQNSKPNSLLSDILNVVEIHKDMLQNLAAPSYGSFFGYYEYLMWILFDLMKSIYQDLKSDPNFSSIEMNQLLIAAEKNLDCCLSATKSRLLTRDNYYFFASKLAVHQKTKSNDLILKNFNFSSTPLCEILKSKETIDLEDLSLNFRYSLLFFDSGSTVISSYDHLVDAYKEFMNKITEDIEDPSLTEKLKHIGILMTGIISHNSIYLRPLRDMFIKSILEFFANKAQPDSWELASFQKSFWKLLICLQNETPSVFIQKEPPSKILLHQSLSNFLVLCEDKLAQTRGKILTANDIQLIKDEKCKQKICGIISSSLENIKNELNSIWDSPKRETKENQASILELQHRKLVYFAFPWIANFASVYNKDEEDLLALKYILDQMTYLYFHPSWVSVIENCENKALEQNYIQVLQSLKQKREYASQIIFEQLSEALKQINIESLSDPASQRGFLRLIQSIKGKCVLELETLSTHNFKNHALLYSTLIRLPRLHEEITEDITKENRVIDSNKIIETFRKFTEIIFWLASFSDVQDIENQDFNIHREHELFFRSPFGGLRTFIKLQYQIERNESLLVPCLIDFLNKVFQVQNFNNHLSYFKEIFAGIILSFEEPVRNYTLNVVLCHQKTLRFILKWILDTFSVKMKILAGAELNAQENSVEYERVLSFVDTLLSRVSIEQNIKEMKHIKNMYFSNSGSSGLDLLQNISEHLKEFPVMDLINLDNDKIKQEFVPILKLFEKIYTHAKTDFLEDFEKHETQEITNNQMNSKEAFENLEIVHRLLDQAQVDLFWFIYDFKELDETASDLINKKVVATLSRYISKLSYLKIKEAYTELPKELMNVSFPNLTKDEMFTRKKIFQNDKLNDLLNIQYYLQQMMQVISQVKTTIQFDGYFIWNLCYCSTALLNQLITMESSQIIQLKEEIKNFPEAVKKLQLLLKEMAELFVNHFATSSQGSESCSIFNWLENILKCHVNIQAKLGFDIICLENTTLPNLMTLLHIFLALIPGTASDYLLNNTSLINSLMELKEEKSGKLIYINHLSFLVDSMLKNSSFDDIFIETKLKQIWIEKSNDGDPIKLIQLLDNSSIREKEYTSMKKLIDILLTRFKFTNNSQDPISGNDYSSEELNVSLNLSEEDKTPEESIDRILRNIPTEVQKLLDILKESLIGNYLYNLSYLSEIEDKKKIDKEKFRQTSSIVTVMSMLFEKYRCLVADLAFRKTDYSHIVSRYSQKIPFLKKSELKIFESITFMECLFETKYMFFNENNILTMIQMFMLNTGITFRCPEKPALIVDISKIITIKLIVCFIHETKKEISFFDNDMAGLMICYHALYVMAISADCILNLLNQNSLKNMFGEYTRLSFLNLIKNIVKSLALISKNLPSNYTNFGPLSNILIDVLKQYYKTQLSLNSLTNEDIEKFKQDDYESFLGNNDIQSIQDNFESFLQNVQSMQYLKTEIGQGTSTTNSKYSIDPKKNEKLNDKNLKAPITPLRMSVDQNFSNLFQNHSKRLSEMASTVKSSLESAPKPVFKTLVSEQGNNNLFLNHFENFSVNNINPSTEEQPGYPYLSKMSKTEDNFNIQKRFYEILSEKLNIPIKTLQKQERGKALAKSADKGSERETLIEIVEGKSKQGNSIYFADLSTQTKDDFYKLKSKILFKLKNISEQVLTESTLLPCAKQDYENLKKQVTIREISNQLSSMPEFEQNFMLCYIDKFEVLKLYEYPNHIQKIKQELGWIEEKFSSRSSKSSSNSGIGNDDGKKKTFYYNMISGGFSFCNNDNSINMLQQLKKNNNINNEVRTNFDENKLQIKQIYLIDEETVESLISSFFTQNSHAFHYIVKIFEELCKSAVFEIKILDFCFFFLYCPDHFQSLAQNTNSSSTFNIGEPNMKLYETMAINILEFLRNLFNHREGIVYQPIVLFEHYGLKSLKDIKQKCKYQELTSKHISICDIVIDLLELEKIKNSKILSNQCELLLMAIFVKPRDFDVAEIDEVQECQRETNILTTHSCQKLIELNKKDNIIKFPPKSILLTQFDSIFKIIKDDIQKLYSTLERANSCLKLKVNEQPALLNDMDIEELSQFQSTFKNLSENILSISSVMLEQMLKADRARQVNSKGTLNLDKKNNKLINALRKLNEQGLHDNRIQDFFIHLFELGDYLSFEEFAQSGKARDLMLAAFRICIGYYVLISIQENSSQVIPIQIQLFQQGGQITPSLSKVISAQDTTEEMTGSVPVLMNSFSSIRRTREFDFDCLITNMSRKLPHLLSEIVYEDVRNKIFMKEIAFISGKIPWFIDLATKKKILMDLIFTGVDRSTRNIKISRKDIIGSTLAEFANKPLETIKRKVNVNFKGEQGIDGGGLTREWMTIIIQELFDPKKGLFEVSKNGNSIQLNPLSKLAPGHLKYIEFAGIMLGKVIQEGLVVDVDFTKHMLKHILGRQITIKDLEDIDPDLARNLQWILENKINDLGLDITFTYEFDAFGKRITRELKSNGHEILVTDDNKKEYVKRFCEMKVTGEIKEELEAFIRGIYLILPAGCLSLYTPSEFQLLIGGIPIIDTKELANYTIYQGYNQDSDMIKWLWEILADFSQKELALFVVFATGSVRVSYDILKEKPFRIVRIGYEMNFLPIANTCYHQIQIPEYYSKEEFQKKLLMAIFEGQGNFGFG